MARFHGQVEHSTRPPTKHGRTRRPISCLPCRHRKLKCDRSLPACGNCVNRGNITACSYASRKPEPRVEEQEAPDLPRNAQDRIDHLEHLVLTLIKSQQQTTTQSQLNTPPSCPGVENDAGTDQTDLESSYQEDHGGDAEADARRATSLAKLSPSIMIAADYKNGYSMDEAHWALLLSEIGEVRSYLRSQHKQYEEQSRKINQLLQRTSDDPGPALLFGSSTNVSRSEILSHLPSRYSCDILVSRFFSHMYPAIYIIHGPTFHKQYDSFWNDSSKTSIVWVAILYAILRIAMIDYIRESDEPMEYKGKCPDLANNYRNLFTDCLILADYTLPHDFLIESLSLHLYAEYVSTRDARSSVWVLIGMIVRLAMRMGYHQPSQPNLTSTPFKAEMRRRAWAFIRQADILLSFQLGLPSMIDSQAQECPLPRNIHDDENFHEDTITLPPSLPDSEPTQISYLIAKTKLAFGFARAVKEINRPEPVKWERILEIDRELRTIYDNIPEHYKLGPLSSQDSLVLISSRFVLSSIHHKSLCVLHSRFLEIAKSDYRYLYSRRLCLSSAMTILRFQAIQNQEIPVDGCMRSLTNYQTSLAIHHYLLAATIISADLSSTSSDSQDAAESHRSNPQLMHGVPSRAELIKALATSARIFGQMRDQSMEAYKAADVLEMLVKKFEGAERSRTIGTSNRTQASQPTASLRAGAGPVAGTGTSAEILSPRPQSHLFARTPRSRLHTTTTAEGTPGERTGLSLSLGEMTSSSHSSSTWPHNLQSETETGLDNTQPEPALAQRFPEFETTSSGSWTIPEDIASFASMLEDGGTSENVESSRPSAPALVNGFSYSTVMALNDPMSTLWNLSSGTGGGFF